MFFLSNFTVYLWILFVIQALFSCCFATGCHCRDANEQCDASTKACSSGCAPGYGGLSCQAVNVAYLKQAIYREFADDVYLNQVTDGESSTCFTVGSRFSKKWLEVKLGNSYNIRRIFIKGEGSAVQNSIIRTGEHEVYTGHQIPCSFQSLINGILKTSCDGLQSEFVSFEATNPPCTVCEIEAYERPPQTSEPSAVRELSSQSSGGSFTVTWLQPERPGLVIVRYIVEYEPKSYTLCPAEHIGVPVKSFDHPASGDWSTITLGEGDGIVGSTLYEVRVTAQTDEIEGGGRGQTISTTVTSGGTNPNGQVEELVATSVSRDRITWSWKPPLCSRRGAQITGYQYELLEESRIVLQSQTTNTDVSLSQLAAGRSYRLRVRAVNDYGVGPQLISHPVTAQQGVQPQDVENLLHRAESDRIVLSWNSVPSAVSYTVQWRRLGAVTCSDGSSSPSQLVTVSNHRSTTFTLMLGDSSPVEVLPHHRYSFTVFAVSSTGTAGDSRSIEVNSSPVPPIEERNRIKSVQLTASTSSIQCRWSAPSCVDRAGPISGYRYNIIKVSAGQVVDGGTTSESEVDVVGLEAGVLYEVELLYTDDSGRSSRVERRQITTRLTGTGLSAPTSLTSHSVGETDLWLEFTFDQSDASKLTAIQVQCVVKESLMPSAVRGSRSFSKLLGSSQTSVHVQNLLAGTVYNCSVWGISDELVGVSRDLILATDIAELSPPSLPSIRAGPNNQTVIVSINLLKASSQSNIKNYIIVERFSSRRKKRSDPPIQLVGYDESIELGVSRYVTGMLDIHTSQAGKGIDFTVGTGVIIGGFLNKPLEPTTQYRIGHVLRVPKPNIQSVSVYSAPAWSSPFIAVETNTPSATHAGDDGGLPAGTIAGIVIAVLVAVVLAIVLIILWRKGILNRRHKSTDLIGFKSVLETPYRREETPPVEVKASNPVGTVNDAYISDTRVSGGTERLYEKTSSNTGSPSLGWLPRTGAVSRDMSREGSPRRHRYDSPSRGAVKPAASPRGTPRLFKAARARFSPSSSPQLKAKHNTVVEKSPYGTPRVTPKSSPYLPARNSSSAVAENPYSNFIPAQPTVADVPISAVLQHVKCGRAYNRDLFKQQYQDVMTQTEDSCEVGQSLSNMPRNRYRNIFPYDHNRIVLKKDAASENDYINASYIDGYKSSKKRYIAAQAPNAQSVIDFWRMIWQEKVSVVVMLSRLIESGKVRCEQYWADSTTGNAHVFGHFVVQLKSSSEKTGFECRHMVVRNTKTQESREVTQYHYTSWPDHGVPTSSGPLLELRRLALATGTPSPVVVHCSAGVGRTGTLIALDILIQRAQKEKKINVVDVMFQLRKQRMNSVQTLEQFCFIWETLAELFFAGETDIPSNSFIEYCSKIEKNNGPGSLSAQYEVLDSLRPDIPADTQVIARRPENSEKNRDPMILPPDMCRPTLVTQVEGRNSYINAVSVPVYGARDPFLITQAPMVEPDAPEGGAIDLWRLVYDYGITSVVMLNEHDPSDKSCIEYWPEMSSTVRYGPISIEHLVTQHEEGVIIRELRVKNEEAPNQQLATRTIRHFSLQLWPADEPAPLSVMAATQLIEEVTNWQHRTGDRPVLMHCRNGAERSGVFCALWSVMQRLKTEQRVDVFRAARVVLFPRPQFIPDQDQFEFIFEVVAGYLEHLNLYANLL